MRQANKRIPHLGFPEFSSGHQRQLSSIIRISAPLLLRFGSRSGGGINESGP